MLEPNKPSIDDISDEINPVPNARVIDREASRRPGELCQYLEQKSQTNAPTIIITASKEVAAAVDRIAKRPIKGLTESGIRPYRLPEGLRTADDRLVVQRHNVNIPTVEILEGDINLMWDDTTVEISTAHTLGDHATDLPDGVFFCSENEETWDIESPDDGHVETVDSADSFKSSYSAVPHWFDPSKVSYRSDIAIYSLAQTAETPEHELRVYQPERRPEYSDEPNTGRIMNATFDEFLKQTTVSADGYLTEDDVFNRYDQWLPNGVKISKRKFHIRLSHFDTETTEQGDKKQICGRTWRYVQPNHQVHSNK